MTLGRKGRSGGERVRAQSSALFLLYTGCTSAPPTGSDYSLPVRDGGNGAVQHSALCAAHPLRAPGTGDITRGRGGSTQGTGWGTRLLHKTVHLHLLQNHNTLDMHPAQGYSPLSFPKEAPSRQNAPHQTDFTADQTEVSKFSS